MIRRGTSFELVADVTTVGVADSVTDEEVNVEDTVVDAGVVVEGVEDVVDDVEARMPIGVASTLAVCRRVEVDTGDETAACSPDLDPLEEPPV